MNEEYKSPRSNINSSRNKEIPNTNFKENCSVEDITNSKINTGSIREISEKNGLDQQSENNKKTNPIISSMPADIKNNLNAIWSVSKGDQIKEKINNYQTVNRKGSNQDT